MKLITTKKFLKRIIFILILFIIFIVKANALTTTYNGSLKYSDTVLNLVETYSTKLNNLHNYLSTRCLSNTNTGSVCMSSGKYLIAIDTSTMSTNSWTLTIFEISQSNTNPDYNTYMTFQWRTGTDYNYGYWRFNSYGHTWKINFINNNIRNYTYQDYGGQQYNKWFYASNGINPMNSDIEVLIDNRYFDTYFLNDNLNIDFKNTSSPWLDIPLYNGSMYAIPQVNVESKTFFDSFAPNLEPDIDYSLIKQNGYYDLNIILTNWNTDNAFKYDIYLYDENNAINEYIPPANQGESGNFTITKKVYEAKTYTLSIFNKQTLEADKELLINIPSILYDNFLVEITNIDKELNAITYTYFNMGNNYNFTCTHQIEGGTEISDSNCNSLDNSFTLNVGGNKNVTFRVYNSDNELIYQSSQNFVFQVNQPYINFNETYENGIVNINVVLNRYNETNYTVKYNINNGTLLSVSPTQLDDIVTDMYGFTIENVMENSTIQVNIYNSSNTIIASSTYKVNYSYISNNIGKTIDTNNIKNLFNNLSLDSISTELKTMIKDIGNQIFSTRLGQIIYVTITIVAIGFVISLIRR